VTRRDAEFSLPPPTPTDPEAALRREDTARRPVASDREAPEQIANEALSLDRPTREVRAGAEGAVAPVPRRSRSARALLRSDLSSAGALRRALVLREVLGPPVALREDDET
jgi:hypothetical protein